MEQENNAGSSANEPEKAAEVPEFLKLVKEEQPPTVEDRPSVEEAKAMFADNEGLASVLTVAGTLHRDGSIT